MLDQVDRKILKLLQQDGRISNVDLASKVNLSSPAIHARVRRMEKEGIIKHYMAVLDQEKIGFELTCFISASIQLHQTKSLHAFREHVKKIPEVLECHKVTGEFDYLMKVVVQDRKALRDLIEKLTNIPTVSQLNTRLVVDEVKATAALPLDDDAELYLRNKQSKE